MITRERYLAKIRPFQNKPVIKILTGIRRAGKSTMLKMLQSELRNNGVEEKQILEINFETSAGLKLSTKEDLLNYVSNFQKRQKGKSYLFFDEIQQVNGWEKVVNSFLVDYNADIYLTGSNASLLSGTLATHLAGRYVSFQIHPFSFLEFQKLFESERLTAAEIFRKYVTYGGMPFLKYLDFEYEPSMQYLRDIYSSVVIKDIVIYKNLRDVDLLDRIIRYVISNTGQTFSATSLSNYFKNEGRKVSVDTILDYLKACEEAFLFTSVKREDLIGKKILQVQEKYYIEDHGLREAVIGNNSQEIQLILENIIYAELISRGFTVTVGINSSKEIDFVCNKEGKKSYYQVAYLLADQETINREFNAYKGIGDNYPKYVLSMDTFDLSRDGIIHKNILDFLMEPPY